MKNFLTLLMITSLIVSCGKQDSKSVDDLISDGNIEALKTKRAEIKALQQQYVLEIEKIDEELNKNNANARNPLITSLKISTTDFKHYLEVQGNVVTKQNIIIYPEYSGLLTHVYVKEGQSVKKGQELARIDDGGLSQQLSQLEAQAALAKTTFERQKRLWDQKIGSEMEYLQAETNYTAQTNMVEQLKDQLAKTIITAPFSGIIDDVFTEQGTVVAPGQSQLMRLVNLNNMYIEAEVPENNLRNVKKGKHVEVFFPVLGKTIDTEIRQVGNYINPSNRSFKIEVGLSNKDGDIKPNLTSRLKINDYRNPEAILIPQSIIIENASNQQYVYAIKDKNENLGKAVRTIITTGKTQGDYIEVLEGLSAGDEIIEEGARNVNEGQTVEILSN